LRRLAPLLVIAVAGCVGREEAILMAPGSYGDVAIVVSTEELKGALGGFLGEFNDEFTFVIAHEKRFNVDVFGPDQWHLCKAYKNVIFVIEPSEGGKVVKAVASLVSRQDYARLESGAQPLLYLDEPFAQYQFAAIVAGPDRNTLISLLRRDAPEIRDRIESKAVDRIRRRYLHDGLRTDLMTQFWNLHRFYLEVPQDYVLNQDRPEGYPAIELMQTGPSRGLTIGWREVADPAAMLADREALVALREDIGRRMHTEEIVPETLVWRDDTLAGKPVLRLEGAWNSSDFAGGGAFWCWFVADPGGHRVFCLDALSYAPGMDKMEMFRRMRAVFQTFSLERPQG
jgi:hypothetical protein